MPSLKVDISGDNSQLSKALAGAQDKIGEFTAEVTAKFKEILKANVFEKISEAVLDAPARLIEGFKGAVEAGAQLQMLHERTGASIQDLAVLQEAFKENGLAADQVGPAINKMQKALSGVNEEGTNTTSIFSRLGIDPKKLQGLGSATAQLQVIQQKIEGIKNPAERASAAMQIFGKSGGEMLALFGNSEALGRAGENLGSQAGILAKDAALFHEVGTYLESAGNKMQGFFVGIADQVAPVLLPILEKFNKLDFAKWGQEIGGAVGIIFAAFGDGKIEALFGNSLALGAKMGGNILSRVLRGLSGGLVTAMMNIPNIFVAVFDLLMSPGFWGGLVNVLAGAATKFGSFMLRSVEPMVEFIQAGLDYAFQQVIKQLANIPGDPFGLKKDAEELRENWNQQAMSVGAQIARVDKEPESKEKDLKMSKLKKLMDEAESNANAAGGDESFQDVLKRHREDGGNLFGLDADQLNKQGDQQMATAGTDFGPVIAKTLAQLGQSAGAIGKDFTADYSKGPDAFDVGGDKSKLGDMIAQFQKEAAGYHDSQVAKATGADEGGAGDADPSKIAMKEKTKVIAGGLARIGGGGNFAGGFAGLQREGNGLLRKIESAILKTGGLKTATIQPSAPAVFA